MLAWFSQRFFKTECIVGHKNRARSEHGVALIMVNFHYSLQAMQLVWFLQWHSWGFLLSGIQYYTMGITESIILRKHTAFIFKGQTVLEESHYFLQNIGILPSDNISYSTRMNEWNSRSKGCRLQYKYYGTTVQRQVLTKSTDNIEKKWHKPELLLPDKIMWFSNITKRL